MPQSQALLKPVADWSPRELVPSVWYQLDNSAFADDGGNDVVTQIFDQSGNNEHLLPAADGNRGDYVASSTLFKKHSSVRMNGTTDYYEVEDALGLAMNGNDKAFTAWFVGELDATGDTNAAWSITNMAVEDSYLTALSNAGDDARLFKNTPGTNASFTSTDNWLTDSGKRHIWIYNGGGGDNKMTWYKAGSALNLGGSTWDGDIVTMDDVAMGALVRSSAIQLWKGEIAELGIVAGRAVNATELFLLDSYLFARYGK